MLLSGIHKPDEACDLSRSIFPGMCVQELFVLRSRRSASALARHEVTQGQDGTKLILWRGGLAINQFWKERVAAGEEIPQPERDGIAGDRCRESHAAIDPADKASAPARGVLWAATAPKFCLSAQE